MGDRFLYVCGPVGCRDLAGLRHSTGTDEELKKEYAAAKPWPGVTYTTVKAYVYNLQNAEDTPMIPDPAIMKDGILVPSVVNREGVTLSPEQVQMLIAGISKVPLSHNGGLKITRPMCIFNPHHAFVFYDAQGKVVAWVPICTMCADAEPHPPHEKLYNYDFKVLDALLEELHLPVLHTDEDMVAYRESLSKGH